MNDRSPMRRAVGVISSALLWTMSGSSYVPGTLALIESPSPDVLKMTNCASLSPVRADVDRASALRGLAKNAAGSPVASDRSPT